MLKYNRKFVASVCIFPSARQAQIRLEAFKQGDICKSKFVRPVNVVCTYIYMVPEMSFNCNALLVQKGEVLQLSRQMIVVECGS